MKIKSAIVTFHHAYTPCTVRKHLPATFHQTIAVETSSWANTKAKGQRYTSLYIIYTEVTNNASQPDS